VSAIQDGEAVLEIGSGAQEVMSRSGRLSELIGDIGRTERDVTNVRKRIKGAINDMQKKIGKKCPLCGGAVA